MGGCRHTELKVSTQSGTTGGVIGLHAHGLHIDSVSIDGVPADFEFTATQSHYDHRELEPSNGSDLAPYLGSQSNAADLAYSQYVSDLHREMQPDLLIFPPNVSTPIDGSQEPPPTVLIKIEGGLENGSTQIAQEAKPEVSSTVAVAAPQAEEVRVVRVDYWVEKPAAGVHFHDTILHTHNQLRRARCWFPCVDSTLQRSSYDLEFTVDAEYVAVSSGKLLHQVIIL
jgi:transcription initiation factor TFIID subunit 2